MSTEPEHNKGTQSVEGEAKDIAPRMEGAPVESGHGPILCPHCKHALDHSVLDRVAAYGHGIVNKPQNVLASAAFDVIHVDQKLALVGDLWRIIKSPVKGATDLALTLRHHGSAAFFLFGVAIWALSGKIPDVPDPAKPALDSSLQDSFGIALDRMLTHHLAEITVAWVYVMLALALLLSYRRFVRASPIERTAEQFVNLSAIWFVITSLLFCILDVGAVMALAGLIKPATYHMLLLPGLLLCFLLAEIHGVLLNRRFWQISTGRAVYITLTAGLVAILLSTAIVTFGVWLVHSVKYGT